MTLRLHKAQQKNGSLLQQCQDATQVALEEKKKEAEAVEKQIALQEAEEQRDAAKEEKKKLEERLARVEKALQKAEERESESIKKATEAEATAASAPLPVTPTTPTPTEEESEQARFQTWATTHIDGILISAMPSISPQKEQLPILANLHWALQLWTNEGGLLPVTMATMKANTVASKDSANVIRMLLGEVCNSFKEDLDNDETILPRQLMMLAYLALDRLRENYQKDEKAKKKATLNFEAMKTAAKRRRTQDE